MAHQLLVGALATPLVPSQVRLGRAPSPPVLKGESTLSVSLPLGSDTVHPPHSTRKVRALLRDAEAATAGEPSRVGAQSRAECSVAGDSRGPVSAGTLWGHAVSFRSEVWSVSSKVSLGLKGFFCAREGHALQPRECLCTGARERGGKIRPSAGHTRNLSLMRQFGGGSSGGKAQAATTGVRGPQPPSGSGVSSCFTHYSRARASSLAASSPTAPDTTETRCHAQHRSG